MYRRYPHMYKGHIPINREHIYTCTESTHRGTCKCACMCVHTPVQMYTCSHYAHACVHIKWTCMQAHAYTDIYTYIHI